jgi:citrate lyase beta subunit
MDLKKKLRPRRSFIFTPGLRPEMFPKAVKSGVDMVCIELEDGIAPKDKKEAREKALSIFQNQTIPENIEVILRINSIRSLFGLDDIRAILSTDFPPPAIMLPKVNDAEEVKILDDLLNERGHNCELHPIIETNSGLEKAYDIAKSSERVSTLFFGLIDMSAELRCKLSWDQLLYARSRVVHAAAGAGLDAIDGPFMDLEDPKGNIEQALLARDLGFSGKGSIHPKQVNDLNKVFSPSDEKIAKAKMITKIFEEANTGLVMVDGKLIEKPVLREMYRTLSIAEESK